MTQQFTGKAALVTAAASGIGAAIARAMAEEGASLMLADINDEGLQAIASELRESGAQVATQVTDCQQESHIKAAVSKTVEQYGQLDYAANVVGHVMGDGRGAEFHTQSTEGWNDTLNISLTSTYLCMKHEIAHMVEHGGGSIVNISSLAGMAHVPDGGIGYGVAKAGVIKMTKFAAATYGDRNIRVNCIAPGTTLTTALQRAGLADQTMIDRLVSDHVIKRLIQPSEQAAAAVWLFSDNAAMVTGHVMTVDGGWSAKL